MRRLRCSKQKMNIDRIKYDFYVFDVETTKLEPMAKNFVFGVIYGFNYSKVIYSIEDFIKEFESDRFKNKYLYAHNAEFDLMTIFGNIITEIDNEAIFNNKFISAKYKELIFADSMNIYPASVAAIGELLGIPKLENVKVSGEKLTKNNIDLDDIKYCKRDCKIVYYALLRIFETIGAIKLTLPSLAMFYFRNKYMPEDIFFSELVDEFFDSYYGGRTEAFKIGAIQNGKVFDINSLYPFAMITTKFPDVKRLKKTVNIDVKYLLYLIKNYEGMAKVKVHHKEHYFGFLPVRMLLNKSEKLVFPVGTFESTLNFNELRFALKHGVIEILSVEYAIYAAPMKNPFIEFINDLYEKRKNATNEIDKNIFKLLMNSLYGRFGMKLKYATAYHHEIPVQIIRELQNENKYYELQTFNEERTDCYLITENEKHLNGWFSIPCFSSYITSEARIILLKGLLNNENNSVVYCDTDSIFIEHDFVGVVTSNLGDFKEEKKTIIEVSGLKNYKYIDETGKERIVIKGISRNATKEGEGKYSIPKYYKTKQSLRQDKEAGESFIMHKELKHKYDKRIILNNGNTKPIKL
jgi:hypothetical protein